MILNLFSNKNIEKYFLTKKSDIQINSKVDLVLSPEFYWVRVFEIPVDTEKKALDVLPSLFEDILPNGNVDYFATKLEENKFLCYAFNNDDVLEYIKKSGLNLSQVNAVYLAQLEMKEYQSFIIDNSAFIYDKDILIKVPKVLCKDAPELSNNINQIELTKHKINIKFYSNTISLKYIYTLLLLLGTVIVINTVSYFGYANNISSIDLKIEKIRKSSNMPRTYIQTKSILSNMQKRVDKQLKIRVALSYILEFRKSKAEEFIERISYKNNKIKIVFRNISWFKIKKYIEKKYTISNNSTIGDFVNVEVEL